MNDSLLVALQMGDGMGPGGGGFGYGFVGLAMVLLFLVAVTLLITRSFDGGSGGGVDGRSETTAGGRSTTSGDPALAELRERYARGEIDDEEFERRAQQLRSTADSEK
jgi:putative membrane protein